MLRRLSSAEATVWGVESPLHNWKMNFPELQGVVFWQCSVKKRRIVKNFMTFLYLLRVILFYFLLDLPKKEGLITQEHPEASLGEKSWFTTELKSLGERCCHRRSGQLHSATTAKLPPFSGALSAGVFYGACKRDFGASNRWDKDIAGGLAWASRSLAWEIPRTQEPGLVFQSTGSQRVRHD